MTTLQFPANPVLNQEYDYPPYKYYWDGVKWKTRGIGYNPVNDLRDEVAGSTREAIRRSYQEAGYNLVDGSFELGGVLHSTSDVLLHQLSGKAYSWDGTYPVDGYVVDSGTDPTAVTGYVPRTDVVLRGDLSSSSGSGLVGFSHETLYSPDTAGFRLKNAVYATDAPFNAPTWPGDATAKINDALTFCAANNRDLILDRMFDISGTITIPPNVSVICLTRQCGLNSTATGLSKAVVMSGINSRFTGGTIKGINNPTSETIRQDGVYLEDTSSFCEINDVHIYGFYAKGFVGDGTGTGVYDLGVSNKILNSKIVDSKFCINLSGKGGEVVLNYISNHFLTQTVESKPWTSASNFWDGIVSEGIEDYLIAYNTVTECGQSGIYTGGNGGLSISNRIIGNLVEKCWNRGIDQGVNEAQSASNDVIGQIIVSNICRNNRENNIWLAGTSRCKVSANSSIYDAEYATLFAGYYGGHTGIALANGGAGAVPHWNTINDNSCYDSEGYANVSISCGLTASGNIIGGNATPQSIYLVNESLFARNEFNFTKQQAWSPTIIGGGGTVTLGASTGRTVVSGKKANFSITINVASVSSPSGQLTIGYIPPLSGTTLRYADVKVTLFDGLDPTIASSQLVAYIESSDQVSIARCLNGSRLYDARQFLKAGSSISISGEVEFYT